MGPTADALHKRQALVRVIDRKQSHHPIQAGETIRNGICCGSVGVCDEHGRVRTDKRSETGVYDERGRANKNTGAGQKIACVNDLLPDPDLRSPTSTDASEEHGMDAA